MNHIPQSKGKFPQVEDGPARTTRTRKKMMFHADATQDHFAYNVSLNYMDEKGNCYYWAVQDILGHSLISDQTIHWKIERADGKKSWEKIEVIKYHSQKKILEYVIKNDLTDMPSWEWVHHLVEVNKKFLPCGKAYIGSRKKYNLNLKLKLLLVLNML